MSGSIVNTQHGVWDPEGEIFQWCNVLYLSRKYKQGLIGQRMIHTWYTVSTSSTLRLFLMNYLCGSHKILSCPCLHIPNSWQGHHPHIEEEKLNNSQEKYFSVPFICFRGMGRSLKTCSRLNKLKKNHIWTISINHTFSIHVDNTRLLKSILHQLLTLLAINCTATLRHVVVNNENAYSWIYFDPESLSFILPNIFTCIIRNEFTVKCKPIS